MANVNKRVPNLESYYPLNEPQIGAAYGSDDYPQNETLPALFKPLTIRGMTIPNRIIVSPMCQYSSDNGHATDWHLVHIGAFARGGAGAIIMEATAVVPEGRISPEDAGLWQDSQIAPLKRIVDFAHSQGVKIGVQLAHAGRKASTYAPWVHANPARARVAKTYVAQNNEGGWPDNVYGPSAIQFSDKYPTPKEMSKADLDVVEAAFAAAAKRAEQAGFDFIEIHAAHGYLNHEFLSPLSNTRTDEFGGQSLENRMRWPLKITEALRAAWPDKPLLVRISATDFAQGPEKEGDEWKQWGVEQSKIFVAEMAKIGVDFIDVSAGGNWVKQKISVGPGYQVPYAVEIKKAHPDMLVGTVGMITEPAQAEQIIQHGSADAVILARALLRNPHWPMRAAEELGVAVKAANQYERAFAKMLTPAERGVDVHERAKEQGCS